MKKLPIGVQSFEKIRAGEYYYVDKTYFVKKLFEDGNYYFLSRPRRFGKSLFIDTLRCAFEGKQELFEGLYLYDNWDWSEKYPVIRFDFSKQRIGKADELKDFLIREILRISEKFGVDVKSPTYYEAFFELIEKVSNKHGKVILLIDEYDKPILDNIDDRGKAKEIREVLKGFYQIIKPADEYLRFVFLTGVSKFSKVSLFSGLNNLHDITLHPEYNEICGYTQEEFEKVFADLIADICGQMGEGVLEEIRFWYNGYSWGGAEKLYNPFDVLLFLSERDFGPFWFKTATPEFLIKLLMERKYYIPKIENLVVGEKLIDSFDIDFIEPETLLFQTGYLTIKKIRRGLRRKREYHLSYPNFEVKVSLNDWILDFFSRSGATKEENQGRLEELIERNDLEGMKELFHRFFASIPYDWYRRNQMAGYEGYYASVFYAYFTSAGFDVRAEDTTSHGKIDMTVQYRDRIYIFEFKVVRDEKERGSALTQIKERRYWEKYSAREIYLIGVEFEPDERNIVGFEWEKLQ